MREEGGLWAAAPDLSNREREESLRLLGESQGLLRLILLGIALQYHSLDMERCRILEPERQGGESPQGMRATASLVTLMALFGFQCQAQRLAAQTAQAGGCPDMTDVTLGANSIVIALIRLFRLCGANQSAGGSAGTQAGELRELEELTEPVI